jgi:hypothetical protein
MLRQDTRNKTAYESVTYLEVFLKKLASWI